MLFAHARNAMTLWIVDLLSPYWVLTSSLSWYHHHRHHQSWASECPDVKNYKSWLNPV